MNFFENLKRFLISLPGKIIMICILYLIIISVSVGIVDATDSTLVLGIIFVVFGFFGWKALSRITPQIFLIMPIGGWLIYYLIKGLLSIIIGAFVAPFPISKAIVAFIVMKLEKIDISYGKNGSSSDDITVNVTKNYISNIVAIDGLSVQELEQMHRTLIKYVEKRPVPLEDVDYRSELKAFEQRPIEDGEIYGCRTYGEAEWLNNAVVKRMDELYTN